MSCTAHIVLALHLIFAWLVPALVLVVCLPLQAQLRQQQAQLPTCCQPQMSSPCLGLYLSASAAAV